MFHCTQVKLVTPFSTNPMYLNISLIEYFMKPETENVHFTFYSARLAYSVIVK